MNHSISHFRHRELASQRMLDLPPSPELWGATLRLRDWYRHQPDLAMTIEEGRETWTRRLAGGLAGLVSRLGSALWCVRPVRGA